ncbi:MAG: 30S ribosomal protein S11 [Enterobacteriaceae bacterium PSpicST2]|nr:MAG: 30S ribosomal protein S11 [Enterobacteriaceae bacterium PSpicST2]
MINKNINKKISKNINKKISKNINKKIKKKNNIKNKKQILNAIVHINSSFNNTIITFTDIKGNTLVSSTSGASGFKGSKKSTPFSAQIAAEKCAIFAKKNGIKNLEIKVKGPGPGRESSIRSLNSLGFNITSIIDVTPIPHNGCRAPKKRRV